MRTGMLETRLAIETPEGVELLLTPAGPGARILAYLLDWLFRLVVLLILSVVFTYLDLFGEGLYFLAIFLLEWFYPVFFEVLRRGATPGKRLMKLRVLHENGTPISFSGSMIRNLLRVVDFLPLFYVTGMVSVLLTRNFKRLGDLAAGTLVVYDVAKPPRPKFQVQGTLAAPVALSLDEQRGFIGFAERTHSLSYSRQNELANLLQPLLKLEDAAAVDAVQRIANGLVGHVPVNRDAGTTAAEDPAPVNSTKQSKD